MYKDWTTGFGEFSSESYDFSDGVYNGFVVHISNFHQPKKIFQPIELGGINTSVESQFASIVAEYNIVKSGINYNGRAGGINGIFGRREYLARGEDKNILSYIFSPGISFEYINSASQLGYYRFTFDKITRVWNYQQYPTKNIALNI